MKQPWTDTEMAIARDLIAKGNSAKQVAETLGRTRRSVVEAASRFDFGCWKSRPGRAAPEAPDGFAEYLRDHTYAQAAEHFSAKPASVQRWANKLGVARKFTKKPAASPKPAKTVVRKEQFTRQSFTLQQRPESYQRDMSEAGQAADFMRRDRRVFRCDLNGNQSQGGKYWMCGIVWMTDAELIERARAKGFQAVRWAA